MKRSSWIGLWTVLHVIPGLCCAPLKAPAAAEHWVGAWGCGPQLTEPSNLPPAPLANSTLRQFVHVTLGGKRLRARLSNAYGANAVVVNAAHVALAAGAGSAGSGNIDPATDKPLTFHGAPSATIPPGEAVLSDPIAYDLPPLTNLAVTICFGNISATAINGHPGSRTTSFIQSGNAVSAASLPAPPRRRIGMSSPALMCWRMHPARRLSSWAIRSQMDGVQRRTATIAGRMTLPGASAPTRSRPAWP